MRAENHLAVLFVTGNVHNTTNPICSIWHHVQQLKVRAVWAKCDSQDNFIAETKADLDIVAITETSEQTENSFFLKCFHGRLFTISYSN